MTITNHIRIFIRPVSGDDIFKKCFFTKANVSSTGPILLKNSITHIFAILFCQFTNQFYFLWLIFKKYFPCCFLQEFTCGGCSSIGSVFINHKLLSVVILLQHPLKQCLSICQSEKRSLQLYDNYDQLQQKHNYVRFV